MKGSLNPLFSIAGVQQHAEAWQKTQEGKIYNALCDVGERFVNDARDNGEYEDQTGNLRASIGYAVLENGSVRKDGISDLGESRELVESVTDDGFVLIGVAGMEYAAAVESKGYDVITGSVPAAEELLSEYKDILGVS